MAKMAISVFLMVPGVFSVRSCWFFHQMAWFDPLNNSGGVPFDFFDFTYLSIPPSLSKTWVNNTGCRDEEAQWGHPFHFFSSLFPHYHYLGEFGLVCLVPVDVSIFTWVLAGIFLWVLLGGNVLLGSMLVRNMLWWTTPNWVWFKCWVQSWNHAGMLSVNEQCIMY